MTPDVCAEMDADGIEAGVGFCDPLSWWWCAAPTATTRPSSCFVAHRHALDAAGTCAVPSVRWSGSGS
jgi:hypothetical protein